MQSVSSPTGSRSAVREVDDGAVVAAFQPIIDLRDGCVVGYEALARPRDGSSPEELFARARAEGRLSEVDRECRTAALPRSGRRRARRAVRAVPQRRRGRARTRSPRPPPRERDVDHGDHGECFDGAPRGGPAHADAPAHARVGRLARRRRRRLALAGDDAAALSRRDQARPAAAGRARAARRRPRGHRGRAPRPSAATRPCWPRASTPRPSSRWRARRARRSGRASCWASPARCRTRCPNRGARCGSPAPAAIRPVRCPTSA